MEKYLPLRRLLILFSFEILFLLSTSAYAYKRYNADSLRIISDMEFAGSSLSNYGEPLFSLWDDLDWHWTSNTHFLAASVT